MGAVRVYIVLKFYVIFYECFWKGNIFTSNTVAQKTWIKIILYFVYKILYYLRIFHYRLRKENSTGTIF